MPASVAVQKVPPTPKPCADRGRRGEVCASLSGVTQQTHRRRRHHPIDGVALHHRRDRRLVRSVVADRLENHPQQQIVQVVHHAHDGVEVLARGEVEVGVVRRRGPKVPSVVLTVSDRQGLDMPWIMNVPSGAEPDPSLKF